MKAKVIVPYIDRITDELHKAGETVELTQARADELSKGGFVEVEAAPKRVVKTTPRKKTAAKKAE